MLGEDGAILHCSLLKLHVQVVAIVMQQALDTWQGSRKSARN